MRFALLGADPDALLVARAIAQSSTHRLVWAGDVDAARDEIRQIAPQVRFVGDWEELLAGRECDAVIVACSGDEAVRADRLRRLVQAAIPLLVSHPIDRSMLVCFELEMIRRDAKGPLVPFFAANYHAAFRRLQAWRHSPASAALGELEQVVIERRLADRGKDRVQSAFARDATLAVQLAGELSRMAAMAPSSAPAGWANLAVQLSGPSGMLVRWNVAPAEPAAGGRLVLVGSQAQAVLDMPEAGAWRLELPGGVTESFAEGEAGREILAAFERAVAGAEAVPNWHDTSRAVEMADSIERCLVKGRTIELHAEEYSEEETFKGTMTSVGCGLLWGALVLMVLGVTASTMGVPLAGYWPHALVAVLGVFLLLQFLALAFPQRGRGEKPTSSAARSDT